MLPVGVKSGGDWNKTVGLRGFLAAIKLKQRVYQALVMRFVIGRYGRQNIGFMWTVIEPMMLCLGVMLIWTLTKGETSHGISVIGFAATGYMPLTLWRHQTGYAVNLLRNVKFLTIFKNITIFDALLSKIFLEFVSVSAATLVVFVSLYSFGFLEAPHDIGMMLQGWFVMGALGAGSAILLASISEMTEIIEKVNQPFQYFLLPFAGCFYMVDWLPDTVKESAQYIPLTHGYELLRGGYFGPDVRTYGDPFYAYSWAIVLAGLGCTVFERVKDRIEV